MSPQRRQYLAFSFQLPFSSNYLPFTLNWTMAVSFWERHIRPFSRQSCLICENDSTSFSRESEATKYVHTCFFMSPHLSLASPNVQMKTLRFQEVKQLAQGHKQATGMRHEGNPQPPHLVLSPLSPRSRTRPRGRSRDSWRSLTVGPGCWDPSQVIETKAPAEPHCLRQPLDQRSAR